MSDELFGHYLLRDIIGRGQVSEVHRAVDLRKERTVAVKLLRAELAADAGFPDRFRHEAALAGGLAAPHVIPIHDYGNIDATFYIEMPLVDGPDLATVLARSGPLEPEVAVRIVTQVADALDAAHAEGLVHGDVKPSNILLAGASLDFAYLTDFGLARSWTGRTAQDHADDIRALSDVLRQALGGSLPGGSDDRFGTARELADAAHAALARAPEPATQPDIEPATAAPVPPVPPVPQPAAAAPPARRMISTGKALLIAGVVAVLAVAVTLGSTAARGDGTTAAAPPPPPPRLLPVLATTLAIGDLPGQAIVSNDGKRVFATTEAGMAVIDTPTGAVPSAPSATTPLPDMLAGPGSPFSHSSAIPSPDGKRIYLPVIKPNGRSGLNVLDTATMTVTGFIPYGTRPAGAAGLDISPDGATVYASVFDLETKPVGTVLKVIDTRTETVAKEVPLGEGLSWVRLATPGVSAYVLRLGARESPPTAAAIDLRSGTVGPDLPVSLPIGMALSADRTVAYVSVSGGFAVIDTVTNAVRRLLPITSSRAMTTALTPDGHTLCYTTTTGVSVLDVTSGEVTGSFLYDFDGFPRAISLSPDGRRAYIADQKANALLVIDLVPAR